MDEPTPWHRMFGLSWRDYFHAMAVVVEQEVDMSLQKQLLDVLLLRREALPLPVELPDGFEDLGPHNLITFKSYQDTIDLWTLDELIGHFVSYRKRASPSTDDLLPLTDFRRYAVCVRFPRALAGRLPLVIIREGVYEARHFTGTIRIIVISQLPLEGRNAMLHLFNVRPDAVNYGVEHYERRSPDTSSLLDLLYRRHSAGGMIVGDELEAIGQRIRARVLAEATAEERVRGLPAEERLRGLPAEERLRGLPPEQLLAALTPEMREALRKALNQPGAT
ncbi:MAG: hypothetical protein ACRC33_28905 [Gemmataceae bacterium]